MRYINFSVNRGLRGLFEPVFTNYVVEVFKALSRATCEEATLMRLGGIRWMDYVLGIVFVMFPHSIDAGPNGGWHNRQLSQACCNNPLQRPVPLHAQGSVLSMDSGAPNRDAQLLHVGTAVLHSVWHPEARTRDDIAMRQLHTLYRRWCARDGSYMQRYCIWPSTATMGETPELMPN